MPHRDRELDALSNQLGECLGRIDSQVERLLADAALDPDATADAIEEQAGELHDLIDAVLATADLGDDRADLDHIVAHCVEVVIQNAGHPLVVRSQLAGNLPAAACSTGELLHAVQRALGLAAEWAGSGGEVAIRTGNHGDEIELEVTAECAGTPPAHLRERALTLQAFVANWQGRCLVDSIGDNRLALQLELPIALERDHS